MNKPADLASFWLYPAPVEEREHGVSEVERLLQAFAAHEDEEKGFLQDYRAILENCKHPIAGYLLNLIIEDEERHQTVVHSMVATLRGAINWTHPSGAIEGSTTLTKEQALELRRLTQKYIEEEKEGIRKYHKLIKSSSGYYRGLFGLLLKVMIHDSEKHVMILEFLRDELANA